MVLATAAPAIKLFLLFEGMLDASAELQAFHSSGNLSLVGVILEIDSDSMRNLRDVIGVDNA